MANEIINALPHGTVLHSKSNSYVIQNALGQGSFGITYLAKTKMKVSGGLGSIDVNVAVKEFFMRDINGRNPDLTVTSGSQGGLCGEYRKKFAREAQNLGKMSHEGIIKVLEFFEANNTVYYSMEYVSGGSLDDCIERKGCLSESETLSISRKVLDALSYMHSMHMLHLDLKPSNIVMDKDQPKLIDFGLSKQYDDDGNPESSTTVGNGTEGYAPLEQSTYHGQSSKSGVLPVTMDFYAFGATMFKMLTGKKPSNANDIFNDGFPIDKLRSVSEGMQQVIMSLMQSKVKDRPQTDEAVRHLLDGLYKGVNIDEEPTRFENEKEIFVEPEPEPEPAPRPTVLTWIGKHKKTVGLVVGLFIAVVCGIIVSINSGSTNEDDSDSFYDMAEAYSTDEVSAETYEVNGVSFDMIMVEGGTFTMGATPEQGDAYDWEKPTHQVTLSSFMIGKYEVTQAQWEAVMGSNPSSFKGDNLPVEFVSWNDCQTFIKKLNSITGKNFRLPTEAEWEYAARGGNKSRGYKCAGSDNIDDVAWYDDNSGVMTHAVGTKQPNELGLYDMSGNVWEWCSDWYGDYSSSAQTNPTGATSGLYRVCRGGCWFYGAGYCRVSYRFDITPDYSFDGLGLRLVLPVQQ